MTGTHDYMYTNILMPLHSQECSRIIHGHQSIIIRFDRPKVKLPITCYIYCNKAKKHSDYIWSGKLHKAKFQQPSNGKIVGKCDIVDVKEFKVFETGSILNWHYYNLRNCGLSFDELSDKVGRNKTAYAWYITNVHIFDEPVDLSYVSRPECKLCNDGVCEVGDFFVCKFLDESNHICNRNNTAPRHWCYCKLCRHKSHNKGKRGVR